MMFNENKCRVCLSDGAEHQIFEDIDSEGSIYFKLFLCFKEKVEDLKGYPRKVCKSCKNILDTVHDFIATYKASSKLLERALIVVKKEFSESETEFDIKDEVLICKKEPYCDGLDPLNNVWVTVPQIEAKIETSLKQSVEDVKKEPSDENYSEVDVGVASSFVEVQIKCNGKRRSRNKTRKKKPKKEPIEGDSSTPQNDISDTGGGERINTKYKLLQQNNKRYTKIPEKCPMCPQVLASKYYLDCHVKRVHGEKNFICNVCGRGFAFKGEMATHHKVVHLRIVRKKRDFPCDKCDKHFVTSKSLLIHDRSAHTGLRPVVCSVCGKSFFHEDYLKLHMRLHTGETPFKCPICDRGYAQRGNLCSHISHNHRLADLTEEQKKSVKPIWFKFFKP